MEDNIDTSGFYKFENDELLYAPNFIESFSYQLNREYKNDYVFPIHGWYWFDTEHDAKIFFNLI